MTDLIPAATDPLLLQTYLSDMTMASPDLIRSYMVTQFMPHRDELDKYLEVQLKEWQIKDLDPKRKQKLLRYLQCFTDCLDIQSCE